MCEVGVEVEFGLHENRIAECGAQRLRYGITILFLGKTVDG